MEAAGRPLLYAALCIARFYRPGFHETSDHVYRAADRLGVYPVIDHYHEPPVRPRRSEDERTPRQLPGIDLRIDAQLELLGRLRYRPELEAIPIYESDTGAAYYANPSFAAPDAQLYYSLLRHLQPLRVIEVGSGQSTRFAARALARNAEEGSSSELVAIEPYEAPELESLNVHVVRQRVEVVDREIFASLAAGDVLFIDSSHVASAGGDVTVLMLEILPLLPPGVLVHVHDVFTPRDYPAEWARRRWFWTEQYVVEALLTNNPRLEVVLAVDHLLHEHPEALTAACPVQAPSGPGPTPSSFWLRVSE